MDWAKQMVTASDGIHLATFEGGRPDAPTVLLVHGFPDDHHVWDGVAERLSPRYRLLTYDVRGAGESGVPAQRSAYRLEQLIADIATVAGRAGGAVHLIGHDWGSIQAWHAVTRADAARRYASFISVSGPDLAMAGAWLADAFKRDRRAALKQVSRSWYLPVFRLPKVPDLLWRSGLGFRSAGRPRTGAAVSNAVNGLNLYRANLARSGGYRRPRDCPVPVLVVAPRFDPYVGVAMQSEAPARWTTALQVEVIDGGHWVIEKHPERISEPAMRFLHSLV